MNTNGYPSVSISEIDLAVTKGLLTKAEARAVILSWFPQAKAIADARALLDSEKEGA